MGTFEDYFSVQAFLIILRETLESAIIISVLLSFVHQTFYSSPTHKESNDINGQYSSIESTSLSAEPDVITLEKQDEKLYRYLKFQIWLGGLLGLVICLLIGSIILAVFYYVGNDLWSITEHYWEATFSILASIIISIMGIKILRVNKMQEKWKLKLGKILQKKQLRQNQEEHYKDVAESWSKKIEMWGEKYNMFILPFITTLREGLEAIVFIGGIGINENTSIWSIVNSTILAIILGSLIGVLLYRSGNTLSLQVFLITSTCFLYLVAAGLFSKGIWNFELQRFINLCGGMDVSETGHGPGSYDIANSVWHVNCCNGEMQEDGAMWMIFTAIFGWTNSATYGSVLSYIGYWIIIIIMFTSLLFEEKHGYLPIIPIKWQYRRIQKRANLYNLSENDINSENGVSISRVSTESTNSQSPLQS
ncbi:unnamed protein product [Candida verbasci]|uniref:Iron permease FTR1 n=1 Tax=Candida verbasci TaxID=1227364 RepID=A0A9W4X8Q4_9ASCO|nr:unnamed protein product [Candida verbasci]